MLFGHNTNITIAGGVYHVQTEDRGVANALIDTTVYCRGRVLHRRTDNYFDLLPLDPDREAALKLRLDEQHRAVLEDMRSGALHLTLPPSSAPGSAAPERAAQSLILLLANPKSWLTGKHASLKILVSSSNGLAVSGAKVALRVEGSAVPFELSRDSGTDGFALLEFDLPKLSGAEPAISIEASHSAGRGQLRFQLRAKPHSPAP
jgi:hypothetical protein